MRRQISIKTKFGWISVFEEKDRIVKVKFGKHRNIYTSKNLKKFKSSLNDFLNGKNKSIKSNHICIIKIHGNPYGITRLYFNIFK